MVVLGGRRCSLPASLTACTLPSTVCVHPATSHRRHYQVVLARPYPSRVPPVSSRPFENRPRVVRFLLHSIARVRQSPAAPPLCQCILRKKVRSCIQGISLTFRCSVPFWLSILTAVRLTSRLILPSCITTMRRNVLQDFSSPTIAS